MSIEGAYDQWADSYDHDRNLTRDLDADLLRESLAGLRFESVLEAGCGTGKNTGFLAEAGTRVWAMDFSAGMLALAAQKVRAGNVGFLRADLRCNWPLNAGQFDLVTFDLVLEHIQLLAPVFADAARVLAPGGMVYVSELHPFRQYQGKKAEFETGQGRAEIKAYVHHISDFLSAASAAGLQLVGLREGWHAEDAGKPPRLVVFSFRN